MSEIIRNILKKLFPPKPDLQDFIVDMKVYNNEIKNVMRQNEKKANELRARAKGELKSGNQARVKMYMNQYMKAKTTAYSLDMFTIAMEGLVFDLQNASSLNNIGLVMGKISKSLGKLGVLDISDISKMMTQVNKQMGRMGIAMDTIFQQVSNYDPFTTETYTDADVEKEMELLTEEVKDEIGVLPEKISDLMERRRKLEEK